MPTPPVSYVQKAATAISAGSSTSVEVLSHSERIFRYATVDFLIRWLTEADDLVVDPFAGRMMVGRAAEEAGRRWICVENILEHVMGAATLFRGFDRLWINPALQPTSQL